MGLILRAVWGARGVLAPRVPQHRRVIIHHEAGADLPATATPAQEQARMRAIDAYHLSVFGPRGFAYVEAWMQSGRAYEGRGLRREGAHTRGHNGEMGVLTPGDGRRTPMTAAAIATGRVRIAQAIAAGDLHPDYTVSGHRDHGTTDCPGPHRYNQLHQLRDVHIDGLPDRIGVVRGRRWLLRNTLTGGPADLDFRYGADGDIQLMGDWLGIGIDLPGVFRDGRWLLRTSLAGGDADIVFWFGQAGDIPVAGDWTGEGRSLPGVVRDGTWHLRGDLVGGDADVTFRFGRSGDIPVAADWLNIGVDLPGVVRDGVWHLRHAHHGGPADDTFRYGRPGDIPLAGRWDGRRVGIGVRRGATWHLKDRPGGGPADRTFTYGRAGDRPVVGAR